MIAIRVDGNSEIATGHIMRCLAVANGLQASGKECIFIVADNKSESLLSSSGFKIINLHSVWNDLDSEISKIIAVIEEQDIDRLIVDTYFVTEKYLYALEEVCRVIYIDDLNAFKYPVSVLINYNLYASDIPYSKIYAGTNTRLLLGPKYAPLRSEFQNIKPHFRENVKKILITAGGVDTYNAAGEILQKVVKDEFFNGIEFHVVAGQLNSHTGELESISKKYPNVIIHKSVERMSELMCDCDIAVTAGGSTMYELCACGVPSICFSWADNQIPGVSVFTKMGFMISAGDIRNDSNKCVNTVVNGLKMYCRDSDMRVRCGKKLKGVVDGEGTKRICDFIEYKIKVTYDIDVHS